MIGVEQIASDAIQTHSSSHRDEVIAVKLREFEEARKLERRYRCEVIIGFGLAVLLFGIALHVVRNLAVVVELYALDWLTPVSHFFITFGVVFMSSCPLEDVDFDASMKQGRKLRLGLFVVLVVVSIVWTPLFVPLSLAPSLLGLTKGCHGWLCLLDNRRPLDSSLVVAWLLLLIFQQALVKCFKHWDVPFLTLCSIVLVLLTMVVGCRWLCLHQNGLGGTEGLYMVLYAFYFVWGINWISFGFVHEYTQTEDNPELPCHNFVLVACGSAFLIPLLVLIVVGRERLFRVTARYLDRKHKERDGAFLAELLDGPSSLIAVGQVWYVHRLEGEKDNTCPATDFRYHWRQGHVVEITDTEFKVRCPADELKMSAIRSTSSSFGNSKHEIVSSSGSFLDGSFLGGSYFRRRSRSDVVFTLPLGGRSLKAEVLLNMCREGLRCIDWSPSIFCELLTGEASGELEVDNWFDLSRPIGHGERIDFFISHSWYRLWLTFKVFSHFLIRYVGYKPGSCASSCRLRISGG